MTYTAVDTAVLATRAAGDVKGRVDIALVKKAAVQALAIGTTDKLEAGICRAVLDGGMPASWPKIVLEVLDINGVLANPTDAQVDTAVDTAWTYFKASRTLT